MTMIARATTTTECAHGKHVLLTASFSRLPGLNDVFDFGFFRQSIDDRNLV